GTVEAWFGKAPGTGRGGGRVIHLKLPRERRGEVGETVAVQSQVEDVATLGAADVRELNKTRHFEHLRVHFGGAPAHNLGRLGMLARGDHGPPRLDDTSLLIGDRRARRA